MGAAGMVVCDADCLKYGCPPDEHWQYLSSERALPPLRVPRGGPRIVCAVSHYHACAVRVLRADRSFILQSVRITCILPLDRSQAVSIARVVLAWLCPRGGDG